MLIIFANSLNPDQAKQNASLDVGPNCLYTDGIPGRKFKKITLKKISR